MKVVFSHPTGNANVRAAASGLVKADLLYEFHTAVASFPGSFLDGLGTLGPLSEIHRRRFDKSLKPLTRTWPWRELGRLASRKAGLSTLTRPETGLFSIEAVYHSLDGQVASSLRKASKRGVGAAYAYEDAALYTFREAKRLGLQCLYDLPTGHWRAARRLLKRELERWPEWQSTMAGFGDSQLKLAHKDEELRLADRIFVASQFTAQTLKEFPGPLAPVEVIPYGFPAVNNLRDYAGGYGHRPLKLLFVGTLSQQKGIADLFAAVNALGKHIELTVVGHKASEHCAALDTELAKHRWIPSLPHEEVLRLMQAHDVFVFPSLFDGFGLVITEAMAQGTPVITTNRTAGPDLIEHAENGWLVQAGSTQALQAAIEELLYHPKQIAEVGKCAMETARLRSWNVYIQEVVEAIKKRAPTESTAVSSVPIM